MSNIKSLRSSEYKEGKIYNIGNVEYLIYKMEKMGSGTFGTVYLAKSLKHGVFVAIKVEKTFHTVDEKNKPEVYKYHSKDWPIYQERKFYRYSENYKKAIKDKLDNREAKANNYLKLYSPNIPQMYQFETSDFIEATKEKCKEISDKRILNEYSNGKKIYYRYNYLVIGFLGPTIETIFKKSNYNMTINDLNNVSRQCIKILRTIHNMGFVHRDLKPENISFGANKNNKKIIYIFDYGLSNTYKNLETGEHNKFNKHSSRVGTASYMSINVQQAHEYGRRDDMISLGYILIYLFNGQLPWQGIKFTKSEETKIQQRANNEKKPYNDIYKKERNNKMINIKKHHNDSNYKGLNLLEPLYEYINNVIKLKFDEEPDYDHLLGLFEDVELDVDIDNLAKKEEYSGVQ